VRCFNPRLTSAARRTWYRRYGVSIINVSIRASLQQRGELGSDWKYPDKIVFQSAPHFSSEANRVRRRFCALFVKFQSAPHFSSEANSPLRQGRRTFRCFNPRLTSAARRTCSSRCRDFACACFNPRLTSAARRTPFFRSYSPGARQFQSAPHFSSEANAENATRFAEAKPVSIRASLQQRGEPEHFLLQSAT